MRSGRAMKKGRQGGREGDPGVVTDELFGLEQRMRLISTCGALPHVVSQRPRTFRGDIGVLGEVVVDIEPWIRVVPSSFPVQQVVDERWNIDRLVELIEVEVCVEQRMRVSGVDAAVLEVVL